jgi:hypothetical protein
MRSRDLAVGDFVEERLCPITDNKGKGYVISITSNEGQRLPLMATILWSDGTLTSKWQDDLTLVKTQEYLIQ